MIYTNNKGKYETFLKELDLFLIPPKKRILKLCNKKF